MNFGQFQKSLNDPEPIYIVVTDQDYLKKRVFQLCMEQVAESARAFDWTGFDLSKDDPVEVISRARTLPWMTARRWVYVRNADEAAESLQTYLSDPSPRTVLVLESGKNLRGWPKIPSVEMDRGANAISWVQKRLRAEGFTVEPGAAETLVELVGEDLQRLESEIEKQILWQFDAKQVSVDSVLGLVAEARERDIFELIDAIAQKRRDQALQILNRLGAGGMVPPQILSMLNWSFRRLLVAHERLEKGEPFQQILKSLKIWSYKQKEREIRSYRKAFLIEVILKLRDADRFSKTTSINSQQFLERVIIDTCRKGSV